MHTEGAQDIDVLGNISAGSSIWYGLNDERNTHLKLRTNINSNQLRELVAILWAITKEPPQNKQTIITKSAYALNRILDDSKRWEPTRCIVVQNKEIFKAIIAALRSRGKTTHFRKLMNDGENGRYNKARKLAKQGATKEMYNEPNLDVHPNFNLTGVQLTTMTQSLAYKGICELKAQESGQGTA